MGFGGYSFGWIFMLLFWALVIFGVIYLVKHLASDKTNNSHDVKALETLNKRYASDEISKEEYHEKKTVIAQRS